MAGPPARLLFFEVYCVFLRSAADFRKKRTCTKACRLSKNSAASRGRAAGCIIPWERKRRQTGGKRVRSRRRKSDKDPEDGKGHITQEKNEAVQSGEKRCGSAVMDAGPDCVAAPAGRTSNIFLKVPVMARPGCYNESSTKTGKTIPGGWPQRAASPGAGKRTTGGKQSWQIYHPPKPWNASPARN